MTDKFWLTQARPCMVSMIMIEPLIAACELIKIVIMHCVLLYKMNPLSYNITDHTSTVASKRPSVMVMSSSATVPQQTVSVSIAGASHVLGSVLWI